MLTPRHSQQDPHDRAARAVQVAQVAPVPRLALKASRVRQGLTQGQVAAALGVAQQTVAKWETGRSTPAMLGQMRALAALLQAEAAALFPDVLPALTPAPGAEGRCCACHTHKPPHPPRSC